MKKVMLATALAAFTLPLAAHADTILGIYASAGIWNQDFTGNFRSSGESSTTLDMQDDVGFGSDHGLTWSIALEHPIPVLPNVRLSHTDLSQKSSFTRTDQVVYDGNTYDANTTINTSLDLSHDDYLMYYEILDNWVSLDIGVNARHFNGDITLDGTVTTQAGSEHRTGQEDLNAWVPMIYGRADFQLPFTGLSIGGEGMGLSVGDASIKDFKVRIAYESPIGLGIEVGERQLTLDYDTGHDGDLVTHLKFKGAYALATYHF